MNTKETATRDGKAAEWQVRSSLVAVSFLSLLQDHDRIFVGRHSAGYVFISGPIIFPSCTIQYVTVLVLATNWQFNGRLVRTVLLLFQCQSANIPTVKFASNGDGLSSIDGFGRQRKRYFTDRLTFDKLLGNRHDESLFGLHRKIIY